MTEHNESSDIQPDPLSEIPKRHLRIYNVIKTNNEEQARRYYSTLIALQQKENPDRFAQASNSARHLIDNLQLFTPGISYYRPSRAFEKLKQYCSEMKDDPSDDKKNKLFEELLGFCDAASMGRRRQYERILKRLDVGRIHDQTSIENATTRLQQSYSYFSEVAHHNKRVVNRETEIEERLYEVGLVIEKFLQPSHNDKLQSLDDLMTKLRPDESDIKRLKVLLKEPECSYYFFNRLSEIDWLTPLKEGGFFLKSSKVIKHEDESLSAESWVPAQFLKKCVKFYPDTVTEILLETESTDNWNANRSFAEIALELPVDQANTVLKSKAAEWAQSPYGYWFNLLVKNAVRLAMNGYGETALKITSELLKLTSPSKQSKVSIPGFEGLEETVPVSKVHQWEYEEALKALVEPLMKAEPLGTISLLCDQLRTALDIKTGDNRKDKRYDGLHYTRPYLNSDDHLGRNDVVHHLVDSLRMGLEIVASLDLQLVVKALQLLPKNSYYIFERMEVYMLSLHPDISSERMAAILTNSEYVVDYPFGKEFEDLIKVGFPLLNPAEQEKYLKIIESGLDSNE